MLTTNASVRKCAIFHTPPTQLCYLRTRTQRIELVHLQYNIYSCRINMNFLHKGQRQLRRVMMYRPFSKSYIIFVLGFLHLETINTPHKRNIPSTATNGLLLRVDVAAVCDGSEFVLCMSAIKAPRAHST
jgi:hypothetical protein